MGVLDGRGSATISARGAIEYVTLPSAGALTPGMTPSHVAPRPISARLPEQASPQHAGGRRAKFPSGGNLLADPRTISWLGTWALRAKRRRHTAPPHAPPHTYRALPTNTPDCGQHPTCHTFPFCTTVKGHGTDAAAYNAAILGRKHVGLWAALPTTRALPPWDFQHLAIM